MVKEVPEIIVIAGINGSGKTTFAQSVLPMMGIHHFVNADNIARGLNPLDVSHVDIHASRLMLRTLHDLIGERRSFAFETTLSGKGYLRLLAQCRDFGYQVRLIYLWLPDVATACSRIKKRVLQGGHDIPPKTVARRFTKSLHYLLSDYVHVVDRIEIIDYNDVNYPELIAVYHNQQWCIKEPLRWQQIQTTIGKNASKQP
jgi:predicted ABC-type ATPase